MMKAFFKNINDISIRYKLLVSYLALVILQFSLFLVINTYFTTRELETEAIFSVQQVSNQTKSFLDFKTDSIKNTLNFLTLNSTIYELTTKQTGDYQNLGFWTADNMDFTREVFNNTHNDSEILDVSLYMQSGMAAITETDTYHLLKNAQAEKWYKQLSASTNRFEWFPSDCFGEDNHTFLSVIGKIYSEQTITDIIGLVRMDIDIESFETTLEQALLTKNTSIYLVNSSNEILISAGNPGSINQSVFKTVNAELVEKLTDISSGDIPRIKQVDSEDFLIADSHINNTDWRVVFLVPYSDILETGIKSRNRLFFILLCIIPLTIPLSVMASISITKRIKKLISHMNEAETGNFDIAILPSSKDEIGQLTRNYNRMLIRISTLIDDKFKMGREIKNMELKALQAQINPHFLYNTLDLINWMSLNKNAPEISMLVGNLSDFYKISLSKGKNIISIEEELKHVKAYASIQAIRFANEFDLAIVVPSELYPYKIMKIILQPLVENAILHGIREKQAGPGNIEIGGSLRNNMITLYVKDNGVGISEKAILEILTVYPDNDYHGYGVKNINARIKLYYGQEYGLSFQSEIGVGTTVFVRIPAVL